MYNITLKYHIMNSDIYNISNSELFFNWNDINSGNFDSIKYWLEHCLYCCYKDCDCNSQKERRIELYEKLAKLGNIHAILLLITDKDYYDKDLMTNLLNQYLHTLLAETSNIWYRNLICNKYNLNIEICNDNFQIDNEISDLEYMNDHLKYIPFN